MFTSFSYLFISLDSVFISLLMSADAFSAFILISHVQDSDVAHQAYRGGECPRPKDAIAAPLSLWTDECTHTALGQKFHIVCAQVCALPHSGFIALPFVRHMYVCAQVLCVSRSNLNLRSMTIYLGMLPDLEKAVQSYDGDKAAAKQVRTPNQANSLPCALSIVLLTILVPPEKQVVYNKCLEYILWPVMDMENGEYPSSLPQAQLGAGLTVQIWPYLHAFCGDHPEQIRAFGAYAARKDPGQPIPGMDVRVSELDHTGTINLGERLKSRQWMEEKMEELRAIDNMTERTKAAAKMGQRPILPALLGFAWWNTWQVRESN